MLLLLPAWLGLFLICLGHGALVFAALFRWGGPAFRVAPDLFRVFWIGFATLITLIELASLVHAIDGWVVAVMAVIAAAGGPTVVRLVRRGARRPDPVKLAVRALVILLAALVVAHSAALRVEWADTLTTHLQQVRWVREHGTVPGLGWLYGKFGFDQAHHLFAAFTDVGAWRHRSVHVALGFMCMVVVAQWIWILTGAARSDARRRVRMFAALTLPYLAQKISASIEVPSLSGDLAMAMVFLAGMVELVALPVGSRRRLPLALFTLAALGALLFAIKFSGLALTAVAFALPAFALWRRWLPMRRRVLIAAGVLPFTLVLAVMIRRVILTGWPLFPVPHFGLPLSWAVPHEEALAQYLWIKSWARMPGVNYHQVLEGGFFHWFVPWFEKFKGTQEWILFLVADAVLACWLCFRPLRARLAESPAAPLAIVTALLALLYWFFGAPDLRFGGVFFWVWFAAVLAPILSVEARSVNAQLMVLLATVWLVWWNNGFALRLPAEPDWLTLDPVPAAKVQDMVLTARDGSSFHAWAPVNGGEICADTDLPCTPSPGKPKLRKPGDLGAGFTY